MKVILKLSGFFFFQLFFFCLMPFIYSHSKTIKHTFFQKLQLNTIKKKCDGNDIVMKMFMGFRTRII